MSFDFDDFSDAAYDAALNSLGENENELELLNKLNDLTLNVMSRVSGREVEKLKEAISGVGKAFDAKVDAASTIVKTSVTKLASKIWNSKPDVKKLMGTVAKCFLDMGKAIKEKCNNAFKAVGDQFVQFAQKLKSFAMIERVKQAAPQ